MFSQRWREDGEPHRGPIDSREYLSGLRQVTTHLADGRDERKFFVIVRVVLSGVLREVVHEVLESFLANRCIRTSGQLEQLRERRTSLQAE